MLPSCRSARATSHTDRRLIILGIDGMDPQLLHRFMREGKMPNFAKLEAQGDYRPLTTSIPPQSPVAWSNLITGMNAGGHGIFDFIHRDPKTLGLYFSASKVEGPKHSIHLGDWAIPGRWNRRATAARHRVLADPRSARDPQQHFSHSLEFSARARQRKHALRYGHS